MTWQDATISVSVYYGPRSHADANKRRCDSRRAVAHWTKQHQEAQLARLTKLAAFMGSEASEPVSTKCSVDWLPSKSVLCLIWRLEDSRK